MGRNEGLLLLAVLALGRFGLDRNGIVPEQQGGASTGSRLEGVGVFVGVTPR